MNDDLQASLGLRVFRRIVREALLGIVSGYVPHFGLAFDLIQAVMEEVARDQRLQSDQVAESLRNVNAVDAVRVVDEILRSPQGLQSTASLTTEEWEDFRLRLIQLPSKYAIFLAEYELREKRRFAEEEAGRRSKENQRFSKLEQKLKTQLARGQLNEARTTVREMLKIRPADTNLLSLQDYLRKRELERIFGPSIWKK